MHETAQNIVTLFRKIGRELSTSEILKEISEEYAKLRGQIKDGKIRENTEIKRKLAQIHRKALHHLNKLTDMGILAVVKHGEKGEKFFSLKIGDEEEIIEISPKYKKRVIISKPLMPSIPIEGYEQKGFVLKYEPATWIDRLNSIVVFSEKINKENFYNVLIENIFPVINDSINLENFEVLINESDVSDFLRKISKECEDYGKFINLTIYLSELKNKENFTKFLGILSENLGHIEFIFCIDSEDLEEKEDIILHIIDALIRNKRSLYIKNKKIQRAPYFVGRAGPYCFLDREWQLAEDLRKEVLCVGCSQSSVIIDVNKFYSEHGLDVEKFSQLMFNISKSLLSANSIQRRRSEDCFRTVNYLNKGYEADFLSLARNYIRFWNFGLHQKGMDAELVLNMINEAKKKISEFAAAEETIYKSCGMTTRFKLALAPAFETAAKLSPAKYEHLEINNYDDLLKKEVKKILFEKEMSFQIFDGGNEATLKHVETFDAKNIIRQVKKIISDYKIPLFNFDFSNIKGNLKLTHFIK